MPETRETTLPSTRLSDHVHRRIFGLLSRLSPEGQGRLLQGYFDWWHRVPDRWHLAQNETERHKYKDTLAQVPDDRTYGRILDVGCSEGVFTHLAADHFRGADVLGIDISERAVSTARVGGDRARFEIVNILERTPPGRFDLVFCSEMLYYLGCDRRLRLAAQRMREVLEPGGVLVAVHPHPEAAHLHAGFDRDHGLERVSMHVDGTTDQTYCVSVYRRTVDVSGDVGQTRYSLSATA